MSDLKLKIRNLVVELPCDKLLGDTCDGRYTVFYEKDDTGELSSLCDKYGSDKGSTTASGHAYSWRPHNYADFYEECFAHCRRHFRNVFECGLGTNNPNLPSSMGVSGRPGASLRVWRDYFPNANIYGADVDREILFQEHRISTFYVDQTSPGSIAQMWDSVGSVKFDLIVDDGLHTYEAGVCLFENSFGRLRKHGIYIIEDVRPSAMLNFRSYFSERNYKVAFVTLFRSNCPLGDNALVVVRK